MALKVTFSDYLTHKRSFFYVAETLANAEAHIVGWEREIPSWAFRGKKSYLNVACKKVPSRLGVEKVLSRRRVEESPISTSRVRKSYHGDSAFLR